MANFGFEWIEYSRFGWDDPRYNLDYEHGVFRQKSFLRAGELAGKVVLDAGCGNGRYTYWAAQEARYVFGLDLGDGVESASANTAALESVQIVQGDIFNVPFAPATFDAVFSIGVLMHTGDARKATFALAAKVKPGGTLSVHLYGRGNRIYEAIDRTLRRYTTRLSIPRLQRFTRRAYRLQRFLERTGTARLAHRFVRLGPHPHIIFDWYAAPIATHHTHDEVHGWFARCGYSVLDSNRPASRGSFVRRLLRSLIGGQTAVTVKGAAHS
jgi:SAM-dependent methyltransferase